MAAIPAQRRRVLLDFCACCSRNTTSTTSARALTSAPTRSSARIAAATGARARARTSRCGRPNAAAVAVIGDFNGWQPDAHPLEARADSSGIWEATVARCRPGRALQVPHRVARDGSSGRQVRPVRLPRGSCRRAPPRWCGTSSTAGTMTAWLRAARHAQRARLRPGRSTSCTWARGGACPRRATAR